MKNCLVTKLKGSVDNNNLPIFGGVRFFCKAAENPTYFTNSLRLDVLEPVTVKSLDGSQCLQTFNTGNVNYTDAIPQDGYQSEITVGSYGAFVVANMDCKFVIKDKYKVTRIIRIKDAAEPGMQQKNIGIEDISELEYMTSLDMILFIGLLGTGILDCSHTALNVIAYGVPFKTSFGIDINTISSNTILGLELDSTASVGNFDEFLSLLASRGGTLSGSINVMRTSITGTAEGICTGLKALGIYNKNIAVSNTFTGRGQNLINNNHNFYSNDNGDTYLVKQVSPDVIIGTYNTSTHTWSD